MKDKGFTLVELIVVIVILAILVGVTIGGVYSYVNKARINTDINNAKSVENALSSLLTTKYAKANDEVLANIGNSRKVVSSDKVAELLGIVEEYLPEVKLKLKELLPDDVPKTKSGGYFRIDTEIDEETGQILSIAVVNIDKNGHRLEGQD